MLYSMRAEATDQVDDIKGPGAGTTPGDAVSQGIALATAIMRQHDDAQAQEGLFGDNGLDYRDSCQDSGKQSDNPSRTAMSSLKPLAGFAISLVVGILFWMSLLNEASLRFWPSFPGIAFTITSIFLLILGVIGFMITRRIKGSELLAGVLGGFSIALSLTAIMAWVASHV